jgi:hypothetical protein
MEEPDDMEEPNDMEGPPPEGDEGDMNMDLDMDNEFEEPVAESKKYEYNRDLEQILKHAGIKNPKDPQEDEDECAVDYEVSSYDRMDESCGEDCEDCEDCSDEKDIEIHGGHPVHDPSLVRLKTLAGFPMVK